jgi:transcriptional regulator with XRE-family HTH domain
MGQRARIARTLKGLSVEGLAAQVGSTPRRLRRIEDGTAGATADELAAVALALDLPLWFVFEVSLTDDSDACPACGAT